MDIELYEDKNQIILHDPKLKINDVTASFLAKSATSTQKVDGNVIRFIFPKSKLKNIRTKLKEDQVPYYDSIGVVTINKYDENTRAIIRGNMDEQTYEILSNYSPVFIEYPGDGGTSAFILNNEYVPDFIEDLRVAKINYKSSFKVSNKGRRRASQKEDTVTITFTLKREQVDPLLSVLKALIGNIENAK